MAEGLNPQQVQYMVAAMQNPQAAMQLQQQQQIAQQMMQQGAEQPNPNETINEGIGGAHTVPFNKWGGLARAGEQMTGAYLQNQNNQKLGALMANSQGQQSAAQSPQNDNGQPMPGRLLPWQSNAATGGTGAPAQQPQQNDPNTVTGSRMGDIYLEGMEPDRYKMLAEIKQAQVKAQLDVQNAGPIKAAQEGNTFVQTPEGPRLGSTMMGNNSPAPQINTPTISSTYVPQGNPETTPQSPQGQTDLGDMYGAKPEQDNVMPNAIPGTTPGTPAQKTQVPMAGDGQPLLPNMTQIPPANPQGTPNYNTPNTTSGVAMNKNMTEADIKANGAFANESQNLAQEKTRIQNLINTYQQVKSGTLTAQDPAFFQKLAAAGINDSPDQLKSLAGIQNATQNHILQIIGQIKDTNASLEGGQASRTFGSTINKLTEEGESAKDQPEALWNIIAQAKGQVDHHMDMMQGYQTVGGMGNRLNAGATMPADTFATQFTLAHPIDAYVQKNLQTIAPFKGMAGNNGDANTQKTVTKQETNSRTGQTRLTYSDGTQVIQ